MTKMHCEFERLQNEHIVLMMEYGRKQRHVRQIIAEQAAEIRRLEATDVHTKAVLCVGQDDTTATLTQRAIEKAGGRFLRHNGTDGGVLETILSDAGLVICQTCWPSACSCRFLWFAGLLAQCAQYVCEFLDGDFQIVRGMGSEPHEKAGLVPA